MKHHVKNALDTLEGLGFRLDYDDRRVRTDRWCFTHANAPEERLTVNFRMSEPAARTVLQKARQIVGLATTVEPKAKRPRVSAQQKAERAAERRRLESARSLAAAREEEHRARRAAQATTQRYAELDRLLRGSGEAVNAGALSPTAMFTVAEVADATGLTDKAVQRAIDTDVLEAYMCKGREVRVKGADVRAWLRGAVA